MPVRVARGPAKGSWRSALDDRVWCGDLRHQIIVPLALDREMGRRAQFDGFDQVVVDVCVEADTALFDKTGTLTAGVPRLANRRTAEPSALAVAAAMAAHSGHPYSRALAAGANPARLAFHRVEEKPGMGLEA